jgi:hypothetical protein
MYKHYELDELDEPEEPEDPLPEDVEYQEIVVVHALSAGPGWLKATSCINGVSMEACIYIDVSCSALASASSAEEDFISIYPNPSVGTFYIELDSDKYKLTNAFKQAASVSKKILTPSFKADIMSIQGVKMQQVTLPSNKTQINVSSLPNGTYLILVYDGITGKPFLKRFVLKK